jgi:hypothetical protein
MKSSRAGEEGQENEEIGGNDGEGRGRRMEKAWVYNSPIPLTRCA